MNHSELSHMAGAVDDSTINIVMVIVIIIIIIIKCCGRFRFGAVALATGLMTFLFPQNVSEKTFTLYSHVPNNVLYARLLYNKLLIEKSTCVHYWTPQHLGFM